MNEDEDEDEDEVDSSQMPPKWTGKTAASYPTVHRTIPQTKLVCIQLSPCPYLGDRDTVATVFH